MTARRAWLVAGLIALTVFLTIAPTLTRLEFSGGLENLNIATALEIRRTGNWLLPTLQGEARTAKPPLTAWITAAALRPSTLAGMSSTDPATRDAAARSLAWEVRWPALLASCLIILATFDLGSTLGGYRSGLVSAVICASCIMFLRQARASTTDVQLALWAIIANTFLARAIFRDQRWAALPLAGLALGLAFMSKGPVALVQTVVPVAMYLAWRAWRGERLRGPFLTPALASLALMAAVAVPWFAYVLTRTDGVGDRWISEVTRVGARNLEPSKWYNYITVIPLLFPWVAFLLIGVILGAQSVLRKPRDRRVIALFLLIIPILIMTCFRDRKERYLLPMVTPAALVVAWGVMPQLKLRSRLSMVDRGLVIVHWLGIAVIALGLPIVGAIGITDVRTLEGRPWFTPSFAMLTGAAGAAIVVAGLDLRRRWKLSIVATTLVVMLLAQAVLVEGYRHAREGRSEMRPLAEAIWRDAPSARVFNVSANGRRVPSDLSIYLNREVPWSDIAKLPAAGDSPLVVAVYQREGTPDPQLPAGWRHLEKVYRDRNWWHAFERINP